MSNGSYSKLLWDPVSGDRCELQIEESFSLSQLRFGVYDDEGKLRATFALDINDGEVQLIVDQFDNKGLAEYHVKVPLFATGH